MHNNTTLKKLLYYTYQYKPYLLLIITLAFISNAFMLYTPLLIGKSIDTMIGENNVDFESLKKILILMLLFYLLSSFSGWLLSYISSIISNNVIKNIRKDAFEKIHSLPLRFFDKIPYGDIVSRLTSDIENVSEGLFQGITQIISAIIVIIGTLFFMITINFKITLIIVVITPICFFISSFVSKISYKKFIQYSSTLGEINQYANEIISNHTIVKSFCYEDKSYDNFNKINNKLYELGQKSQFYSSLTNPTTRYVNNIAYILVGVVGTLLSITSNLTIGNISSFITYSTQFAKPINEITSIASQFQSALASAKRIFSLIDEKSELHNSNTKVSIPLKGNISFREVYFSYKPEIELIKNFNLDVKQGQTIAIVGPTGSGKSTLMNLLMGFYEISNGKITIDDYSIDNISKIDLRNNIGVILQDSWLFTGTICENIAYGKPDATFEEIQLASKMSYAHNFIIKLPLSYNTVIEENARNLSQGEKQLLTIARVMLMNPPILILDEATSNIDTLTEQYIIKAFNKIMIGKTSFIVAHRLSTIRDSDKILVMNNGNIIEQGTHEELISIDNFYKNYYNNFIN